MARSETSSTSGSNRRMPPTAEIVSAPMPARRASRRTWDASMCARPNGIREVVKAQGIVPCALFSRLRDRAPAYHHPVERQQHNSPEERHQKTSRFALAVEAHCTADETAKHRAGDTDQHRHDDASRI